MSRNIAAAVTIGVIAAAAFIVIRSGLVRVESETTATVARADAALLPPQTISPLDLMISHGKTLPVEQWRDAF